MTTRRVLECSASTVGGACGRLFAALGDDVVRLEPPGGDPQRADRVRFAALHAGKRSAVVDPDSESGRRTFEDLLAAADVLVTDAHGAAAVANGSHPDAVAAGHPRLVVVSLTGFGADDERPADSLLAEAAGGLATMIGEPDRCPLALGGEQSAHAAAAAGLLGATAALLRRDTTGHGDRVAVTLTDIAAYLDWKSTVNYHHTGRTPVRSGAGDGGWRIVAARDGWVGVILEERHRDAVAALTGDPRLSALAMGSPPWWDRVAGALADRDAVEVFHAAQRLGLPFGYAATGSDLMTSRQLRHRGFVDDPARQRRRGPDAPVVGFPVPGLGEPGPAAAPVLDGFDPACWTPPTAPEGTGDGGQAPLHGLLVLDFGTITAGPGVGRLLADYGATVVKIESADRPDPFRNWATPGQPRTTATSPVYASNNAGKHGLCVNLKTDNGRRVVEQLLPHADMLVENFRVGVTDRLGIAPEHALRANPNLLYLSLSSQGSDGPEAPYSSYGSTLDLLSGLAATTGYRDGPPQWSTGQVNYPDQLVTLLGAALLTHCVQRGIRGRHLDLSQREAVTWTLAEQLGHYLHHDQDLTTTGNRRPHATPHDVYPTAETGQWLALSASTPRHRRALATLIPGLPTDTDHTVWSDQADQIDQTLSAWTGTQSRHEALTRLAEAGVPAAPVRNAAERAHHPHFARHRVLLPEQDYRKGFPLTMATYQPPDPGPAPTLTADRTSWNDHAGIDGYLATLNAETGSGQTPTGGAARTA